MAGKQNSVGVILMVCLNLPYQIHYNRENIYTAAVIPGPSVPSQDDIDHFMRPIAKNLKEHYNPGVWIGRTHKYPNGRHVRSAALLESMDLVASRTWGGLGSPSHTLLCSCCMVTQDKIDHFDTAYPARTMHNHLQHVQLWMSASNSAERDAIWKKHGAQYSEWLCFPWWNVFFASTVAPMHWVKNILEKQLRENMGWSWSVPTAIPSGPKVTPPQPTHTTAHKGNSQPWSQDIKDAHHSGARTREPARTAILVSYLSLGSQNIPLMQVTLGLYSNLLNESAQAGLVQNPPASGPPHRRRRTYPRALLHNVE